MSRLHLLINIVLIKNLITNSASNSNSWNSEYYRGKRSAESIPHTGQLVRYISSVYISFGAKVQTTIFIFFVAAYHNFGGN